MEENPNNSIPHRSEHDPDTEDFLRMYPEFEEELRSLFDKVKDKAASQDDLFEEKSQSPKKKNKIIDDFRIIREIGKGGGMATVFEAEQISLKRTVALKVLPSHLSFSDKAVKRFYREAEAGSRQNHPGIVSIYAVGEFEDMHYIAEEYIKNGYNLSDKLMALKKVDKIPEGYFRKIAHQIMYVAQALQHAHDRGVIHRDIKPSNILLTEEGRPVITDFGLAKIEDALALSKTGDFCGTPYYMSPEQAMSSRIGIDHRTDIYSLGVTMYESLCLCLPFEGGSSGEVLKKILLHEPCDLKKKNQNVPRDLGVICLKAIKKDPNDRYQTMAEFAEDLKRYINGDVIQARPAGLGEKILMRIKRHPVIFSSAGISALFLLFLAGYILFWSYPRILGERNRVTAAKIELQQTNLELKDEKKLVSAINNVLLGVLKSPAPGEMGKATTVFDALMRALDQLDTLCSGIPVLEVAVRNTIGYAFQGVGAYKEAENQHRIALAKGEDKMGSDHEETVKAKLNLGCALLHQKEMSGFKEAKSHFEAVLDKWGSDPGEADPRALLVMDNLGSCLLKMKQSDKAITLFHQVLLRREEIQPPDCLELSFTLNSLAAAFHGKKEYDKAIELFERALIIRKDRLSQGHPETLHTMHNLACCEIEKKNYAKAELLLKETAALQKIRLSENHPNVFKTDKALAEVLTELKKDKEARALWNKIITRLKSSDVIDAADAKGRTFMVLKCNEVLLRQKDHPAIKDNLACCHQWIQSKVPQKDMDRGIFYQNYGDYLCKQPNTDLNAVKTYFEESYTIFKAVNGPSHRTTRGVMKRLVKVYDALNMPQKKEQIEKLLKK